MAIDAVLRVDFRPAGRRSDRRAPSVTIGPGDETAVAFEGTAPGSPGDAVVRIVGSDESVDGPVAVEG